MELKKYRNKILKQTSLFLIKILKSLLSTPKKVSCIKGGLCINGEFIENKDRIDYISCLKAENFEVFVNNEKVNITQCKYVGNSNYVIKYDDTKLWNAEKDLTK